MVLNLYPNSATLSTPFPTAPKPSLFAAAAPPVVATAPKQASTLSTSALKSTFVLPARSR